MKRLNKICESMITNSRYLLVPLYIGLIAALLVYIIRFFIGMGELVMVGKEEDLLIIGLLDKVMVGNLALMIILGGYTIFVKRINIDTGRPQFLDHISSSTLKIKMGMSLIGVTSVHLLKTFMQCESLTPKIQMQIAIHILFIVSTLIMAIVNYLIQKADQNHKIETQEL